MNTSDYDDGQFWLIPEQISVLQVFSVIGLAFVVFLNTSVLLKMLVWREYRHVQSSFLDRILERCVPSRIDSENWSTMGFIRRFYSFTWGFYVFLKELTGFRGKNRKLWVGACQNNPLKR
ncbi:hypothetical protein V7S43_019100 [Phytophthora oleae]|uniref:Uncharacterized protein n=1 Tax=Phytophthora oleae TaxID=2107226 RepID=A0ABD3ET58_9STRA